MGTSLVMSDGYLAVGRPSFGGARGPRWWSQLQPSVMLRNFPSLGLGDQARVGWLGPKNSAGLRVDRVRTPGNELGWLFTLGFHQAVCGLKLC